MKTSKAAPSGKIRGRSGGGRLPRDGEAAGIDGAIVQLSHDILSFNARLQENRARIAAHAGLTFHQYAILEAISQHEEVSAEGRGVVEVADALRLSGAFITIEVNKLVANGLVRRVRNASDRRRVLLTLTLPARDLVVRLERVHRPSDKAIFGVLSAQELSLLRALVPRLLAATGPAQKLVELLAAVPARRHARLTGPAGMDV